MTSPTYRQARTWWRKTSEPVPVRTPTVNTRMTLDRERLARLTMGNALEDDWGPSARHLPSWNLSVQAILALERLLNDGAEPSLSLKELW